MKQGIHPVYKEVIYKDVSSGFRMLSRSTLQPKETESWPEDGKTYPVVKIEISSASHPFFTGQEKLLDTQGRVERFRKRYEKKEK